MKYGQLVSANKAIQRISNFQLPVREAYKVFKLMKELQPMIDFGSKQEKQMIEKYNGHLDDDGRIGFIHGDDAEAQKIGMENMKHFVEELNALNNMEMDKEFTPISIRYDVLGEQTITPNEMMTLDGFITFE